MATTPASTRSDRQANQHVNERHAATAKIKPSQFVELQRVLKTYWGFDEFLPLQREAMQCVMGDRDSLVVLPTGGGKSLCFQAPAMCSEGLAIVVSPLLALMKDQVDAL